MNSYVKEYEKFILEFVCSALAITMIFTDKIFTKVGITEFMEREKDYNDLLYSIMNSIVKAVFLITFIIPMLTITSLLNWERYKKFMSTIKDRQEI